MASLRCSYLVRKQPLLTCGPHLARRQPLFTSVSLGAIWSMSLGGGSVSFWGLRFIVIFRKVCASRVEK